MKHNTLSKHPRRATGLFAMRSSISLLSLKIFCWCSSFLNSRACIWLSRDVMACWCSFCILLPNMRKQHRTVAEHEETTHCNNAFWMLLPLAVGLKITAYTSLLHWCKNFELLWVLRPIHRCARSGYTAHLILLGVVILTIITFDNVCSFFLIP